MAHNHSILACERPGCVGVSNVGAHSALVASRTSRAPTPSRARIRARCVPLALALMLALSLVRPAHAATNVAVLGVRSLDGEDELERRLSASLYEGATHVPDYAVSERQLSLEQMMIAHGCDEPNAKCLGEIATALGVERLLYGTVVASGGAYELTVFSFEAKTARIETAVARALKPERLAAPLIDETIGRLIRRLNGDPGTGLLHITGNAPGAEIVVDGTTRGALDNKGELTLELPAGEHRVHAVGVASGPEPDRKAVVEAGETVALSLEVVKPSLLDDSSLLPAPPPAPPLTPEKRPRSLRRIFGWVSVGIGAAFAGALVYSWVRLHNLNDDADFRAYRAAFPRAGTPDGVSDVCVKAQEGALAAQDASLAGLEAHARKQCDEADKLEVLQYVFAGGTVIGAGVGTYLLLSARKLDRAKVSLSPRFGSQRALLEATLRF